MRNRMHGNISFLLMWLKVSLINCKNIDGILDTLLNWTIQDAMGLLGVPSDLEMIVYVSKQFALLYERVIAWALYFKALHTDDVFKQLLQLLYELPKSMLARINDFVNRMYMEITNLPDVDDNIKREIKLSCVLDEANTDAINEEMERLYKLLC